VQRAENCSTITQFLQTVYQVSTTVSNSGKKCWQTHQKFSINSTFSKVWWHGGRHTFNLFCLFQYMHSKSHSYNDKIQSSISSSSLHLCSVRKNLPGVQSWDLNSCLPYSRPAHHQLSYTAPCSFLQNETLR